MKQLLCLSILLIIIAVHGCAYPPNKGPVAANDGGSDTGSVVNPVPVKLDLERIVTFTVKGKGVEPEDALTRGQGRLLAEKAAIVDGYRQFAEKLSGVYVDAYTGSGYGKVDEDSLKIRVKAMLRGIEIKDITHDEYGIAQAVMELRINFTKHGMVWWPAGLGKDVIAVKTEN